MNEALTTDVQTTSTILVWAAGIITAIIVALAIFLIKRAISKTPSLNCVTLMLKEQESTIIKAINDSKSETTNLIDNILNKHNLIERDLDNAKGRLQHNENMVLKFLDFIQKMNEDHRTLYVDKDMFHQTIQAFESKLDMAIQLLQSDAKMPTAKTTVARRK